MFGLTASSGNKTSLNRNDIETYFKGLILSKMGDMIATYIAQKHITIFEINAYLEDMSNEAVEKLRPVLENFGIEPLNFYFGSVNVNDDDEGIKKLKSAMADRATMNVMGYNYQQKRTFDVLESAAKNEGSGSLAGMGAGVGAGLGFGSAIGQMAAQLNQNINPQMQAQTQNQTQSQAQGSVCPKCGKPVVLGAMFCMYCGQRLTCANCGAALVPGANFCPKCGQQI